MNPTPHVLVVASTPRIAEDAISGLTDAGLRVTLVSSFKAARQGLESHPDLLIAEVRLGEYNGMQLALRARNQGIRAIVLGENDQITRREAESLGADYLADECDTATLNAAVRAAGIYPRRRVGRRSTHAA